MDNPNFQSLLFNLVYIKAKSESGLTSKSKVIEYLSEALTLSVRTLKSIYLSESKNLHFETLNILSRYLGYNDFTGFFSEKRSVLNILDLKSKHIAFRNPTLYKYKYFLKAFILLRNEPNLFAFRIYEILNSTFSITQIPLSSSVLMNDAISFKYEEKDVMICTFTFPIDIPFEDVTMKYKTILKELKSDKNIITNPSNLLVLVTNLILTNKQKVILQEETNSFFNDKFIEEVDFFDIEDFLEFYSFNLEYFIDNILKKYHAKYKYKITKDLKTNFYIKDVPFIKLDSDIKFVNPSSFLKKNLIDVTTEFGMLGNRLYKITDNESNSRTINWNVIIGEFGFGKTTLLLNLEKEFNNSQYQLFFLPLAQLDENAFKNTDTFISHLFSILKGKSLDYSNASDLLFYDFFKSILIKEQRIMFLIDGIDEHIEAYSYKGLQNILNCLNDLQVDCLISLRKEFWDDRSGDLQSFFSKYRKYNSTIQLVDWTSKEILNYIDKTRSNEKKIKNEGISKLKQIVKQNKFELFYGDIPKRPLFLQMIIQDVLHHGVEKRSLNDLYESFLIKKFTRDRDGTFIDNKTGRLLNLEKQIDRFAIINFIWDIMKRVAESMIVIEDNELKLKSFLYEKELNIIIKNSILEITANEIYLNSVLIPFDQRTIYGLKLIFAHRSFQEYYTALYLQEEENILKSNILVSNEIRKFLC